MHEEDPIEGPAVTAALRVVDEILLIRVRGKSVEDDDVAALHERIKVAERRMLVDAVGRLARDGLVVEGRTARFGRAADVH